MLDNPIPIPNFVLPYLYPITIIFGTQMHQQIFFESFNE